jgi:hypothetical protein
MVLPADTMKYSKGSLPWQQPVILCGHQLPAAAVSCMLTWVMWQRYSRTGKVMPAGMVAGLRCERCWIDCWQPAVQLASAGCLCCCSWCALSVGQLLYRTAARCLQPVLGNFATVDSSASALCCAAPP